ncbi:hypothetical protein [Planobispora takensis]|uniref:Uncharacterized protein n=1 Tax=Planobispora takensis TaxID=1367882 RepID=A0A8J3T3P3_9ACTN|nr:hypothetical protein [Planobispora takensis]GII04325.1 hypothetical protein Pta02_63330 [Planobispora takensis]
MGVQSWWGNLLQGGLSAVIGGIVAAVTAWAVVTATKRHDRRIALESEARGSGISLMLYLGAVSGHLDKALENGTPVPVITTTPDWLTNVIRAEIAMFSLGREIGKEFSGGVGDLRRSLEIIEGRTPHPDLIQSAASTLDRLIQRLSDRLMEGRHRQ